MTLASKAEAVGSPLHYFPRIETEERLRRIREAGFLELMSACAGTRHYANLFKTLGVAPSLAARIDDLPWFETTQREIVENRRDFLARPGNAAFEAPGPRGRAFRTTTTWRGMAGDVDFLQHLFFRAGLGPGDRFLNCGEMSYCADGVLFQRTCERLHAFCVPAGRVEAAQLAARLKPYRITAVLGDAAPLAQLTRAANDGPPRLRALFVTGADLPDETRAWMEDVWRAPVYRIFGIDGAFPAVAGETPERDGFCVNAPRWAVERRPGEAGDTSELFLTPLNHTSQPVIRLESGWTGRLDAALLDGLPLPVLRDLRRTPGGAEKIAGALVDVPALERSLGRETPGAAVSCAAKWTAQGQTLTLRINRGPETEERLRRALNNAEPELAKRIDWGLAELKFDFQPEPEPEPAPPKAKPAPARPAAPKADATATNPAPDRAAPKPEDARPDDAAPQDAKTAAPAPTAEAPAAENLPSEGA